MPMMCSSIAKRRRVYVSCGEGVVDVLEAGEAGYRRLGARADGIGSAHLAVRARARPAVRGGAGEVERAGSDLGVPAGSMNAVRGVAALAAAAVLTCWCGEAEAYRPFDGTDAAVAETGEMEIELGPVEYLREGAERALLAPDVRINYGFTPGWEAALEGKAHSWSDRRRPRDKPG